MHPYIAQALAAERARDLQNEASAARLARQARRSRRAAPVAPRAGAGPVLAGGYRIRTTIRPSAMQSSSHGPKGRRCASLRQLSALTGTPRADRILGRLSAAGLTLLGRHI